MINGLEGIPGSGKSYEAVAMHVLPTLKAGRLVITNLPLLRDMFGAIDSAFPALIELRTRSQPVLGVWNPEGLDEEGNGQAFQLTGAGQADDDKNVPVFGSVWDYYSEWKHPLTGQGPLFIIDEAHLALPSFGTSQPVIEWYKLHRHFNADVLLATQSFRDINQPIARLMGMLIKCRKADILGDKDSYIRKVHAGYRGAEISNEKRKYNPAFFSLYRSHTQGNSVAESLASDVTPMYVKLRRFTKWFWVFTVLCALAVAAWYFNRKPSSSTVVTVQPGGPPVVTVAPTVPSAVVPVLPVAPGVVRGQSVVLGPNEIPEPYGGKDLHLTGRMRMKGRDVYTFLVTAASAQFGTVTDAELLRAGYTWHPFTDCAGTLRYKAISRAITCDAPEQPQGSSREPVVMTVYKGTSEVQSRSDGLGPDSAAAGSRFNRR